MTRFETENHERRSGDEQQYLAMMSQPDYQVFIFIFSKKTVGRLRDFILSFLIEQKNNLTNIH